MDQRAGLWCWCFIQAFQQLMLPSSSPTAVGVDDFGLHEAHSEVVKNRRFVEVAESRQVVLSYEDVGVAEVGQ